VPCLKVVGGCYSWHHSFEYASSMIKLFHLLMSGMRESREQVIQLHDTDADAFALLLNFMYDG